MRKQQKPKGLGIDIDLNKIKDKSERYSLHYFKW